MKLGKKIILNLVPRKHLVQLETVFPRYLFHTECYKSESLEVASEN